MKILKKSPKGMRQGQTIFNFLAWLQLEKGYSGNQNRRLADPFHISDLELDKLYTEYLTESKDNVRRRLND